MRDPLDQFAERLIRNGEIPEFIEGLIEKGVSTSAIMSIAERVRARERIQTRIYRGELEATDADGVETMGGQG